MNVSDQIIQVLDALCEKFGLAVDWSGKNVIPYLKELSTRIISWEIATSILWIVIGVVMTIIGIIGATYIWKQKDEYTYFGDMDEGITWFFIASIMLAGVGVLCVLFQCFDIVEAIYLPEKIFYDLLQQYIK